MKNQKELSIKNIFKLNLALKNREKVLIFTDSFNRELKKLGRLFRDTAQEFSSNTTYHEFKATGCHGVEPPEQLWIIAFGKKTCEELRKERLLDMIISKKAGNSHLRKAEKIIGKHIKDSADAVIALSYYSTSHTKFRDFLTRICGTRYASMPLFDESMLQGPMTVDWKAMNERAKKIKRRVNNCERIKIEASNGTSISFSKRGREAKIDSGILSRSGQFSNLPAGEVYLAPLEGTADGKLVIEWAPTRKLKGPLTLHVKKGLVTRVEGEEEYRSFLENKLNEKKENRNIAELGIGTNDKATRPDNILESEKIFSTIHIALGDNSAFGGEVRTSFHQDFVFFKPDVTLIFRSGRKRKLMNEGKIV